MGKRANMWKLVFLIHRNINLNIYKSATAKKETENFLVWFLRLQQQQQHHQPKTNIMFAYKMLKVTNNF